MTEHETDEQDHDSGHDEHGGLGKYIAVTIGLMVLTLTSFGIAKSPIMNTESIGWTGMIAVSCAKASLVILFFMHLKWEANWKYVLTIPASIMSIFLMLMLIPDIGWRTRTYTETRWLHAADPEHGDDHGQMGVYDESVKSESDDDGE